MPPAWSWASGPRWTRPWRPQTNGKAERSHRTLLEEWAYQRPYTSEIERQTAFGDRLDRYNHHRPHAGIAGRAPADRVTNLSSNSTTNASASARPHALARPRSTEHGVDGPVCHGLDQRSRRRGRGVVIGTSRVWGVFQSAASIAAMIPVAEAGPDSGSGRPPAFDPADHRRRHPVGHGRALPNATGPWTPAISSPLPAIRLFSGSTYSATRPRLCPVDHGGRVSASGEAASSTEQSDPKRHRPARSEVRHRRPGARPVTTGRSPPATALLRIHPDPPTGPRVCRQSVMATSAGRST